jgi:chromosome segregation ATPase
MNTLSILEEKIKLLVVHVQKLQSEKAVLARDREALEKRNKDLESEHARLIEENIRLQEKAKEAHISTTKGNKQLDALNKERELTKNAVDELIKSIDGLVSSEVQQ